MTTTWLPDRKFLAGGIAGVMTWLIITLANRYGLEIPQDVQNGITGFIAMALVYLVPSSKKDIIRRIDDKLIILARNDPESAASAPNTPAAVASASTVVPPSGAGNGK